MMPCCARKNGKLDAFTKSPKSYENQISTGTIYTYSILLNLLNICGLQLNHSSKSVNETLKVDEQLVGVVRGYYLS